MGARVTVSRAAWSLFACIVLVPRGAAAAADDDAGTTEEIAIPGSVLFALALCTAPRAPALEASIACPPHVACACRSFTAADPFTPRPPPTHFPPFDERLAMKSRHSRR